MELEIQKVVKEFFEAMGISLDKIDVEKRENDEYYVNIVGEDSSRLIGHHGAHLLAYQHVLKLLLLKKFPEKVNFSLDVDFYKKRQEEGVIEIAERKVDSARLSKKAQILPPMSPYFRRIVHLYLHKPEFADISTESMGHGDMRRVVITPIS